MPTPKNPYRRAVHEPDPALDEASDRWAINDQLKVVAEMNQRPSPRRPKLSMAQRPVSRPSSAADLAKISGVAVIRDGIRNTPPAPDMAAPRFALGARV